MSVHCEERLTGLKRREVMVVARQAGPQAQASGDALKSGGRTGTSIVSERARATCDLMMAVPAARCWTWMELSVASPVISWVQSIPDHQTN